MNEDIMKYRYSDGVPNLRRFHQARWDEPVIFELNQPGQRGLLLPVTEPQVSQAVGDVLATIPESLRRKEPPALPEISQAQVLRHYLRLSQENLGADLNVDIGQGTCTMKYNPKVNEKLARKMTRAADQVLGMQRELVERREAIEEQRRDLVHKRPFLEGPLDPIDLRTSALVLAVRRVARVALARGIWP